MPGAGGVDCTLLGRVCALTGSPAYLAGLTEAERRAIRMNVNLDSVGGSSRLTALCSDDPQLAAFVTRVTRDAGLDVGVFLPLMANSDHANFAALGIPALRLVAGFDEPASHIRYVLTAADTRDKVTPSELALASLAAASILWDTLTIERLKIEATSSKGGSACLRQRRTIREHTTTNRSRGKGPKPISPIPSPPPVRPRRTPTGMDH
jgi:Zn-dependent M28 family amino/carboxypeptidase